MAVFGDRDWRVRGDLGLEWFRSKFYSFDGKRSPVYTVVSIVVLQALPSQTSCVHHRNFPPEVRRISLLRSQHGHDRTVFQNFSVTAPAKLFIWSIC